MTDVDARDAGDESGQATGAGAGAGGDAAGDAGPAGGGRGGWGLRLGVVTVVVIAIVAAVTSGRGDDEVRTGDEGAGSDDPPPAVDEAAATVAFTYGDYLEPGESSGLALQVTRDGEPVGDWSPARFDEALQGPVDNDDATGGLVAPVPSGDLVLEVTRSGDGEPQTCSQPFTAAAGDRLVVAVFLGVDPLLAGDAAGADGRVPCATVEAAEEWAGPSGPVGEGYVGLTTAEAEAQATEAGYVTRVVAVDGQNLAVTMELREDRLNLVLYDGEVLAAHLDGEGAR